MNLHRLLGTQTPVEKVTRPLAHLSEGALARSGLTAGATVLALSAASAATSALRRRAERP